MKVWHNICSTYTIIAKLKHMKSLLKSLSAAAFLLAAANVSYAQNAHEGRVSFMKGDQNAVVAEYDLPKNVVEDALKQRFEKAGLSKRSTEKGFMAYKGATWTEVSPDKVDVYAKVEGKGAVSTITVLVSKGYDNFISSASDPEKVQNVQAFLNSFIKDAKLYQLKLSIAAQEEAVKKAEKDLKTTTDDGQKLVKDKEKIEKQIADNQTAQGQKQATLDAAKVKLEELKRDLM